jgi:hypothetical protein
MNHHVKDPERLCFTPNAASRTITRFPTVVIFSEDPRRVNPSAILGDEREVKARSIAATDRTRASKVERRSSPTSPGCEPLLRAREASRSFETESRASSTSPSLKALRLESIGLLGSGRLSREPFG